MGKNSVTFFLLICISFSAFASNNLNELDALEQIEYELEKNPELKQKEIQENEINFIKTETLKKYDYYDSLAPKEDTFYNKKERPTLKPFRAAIKAGAILESVDGQHTIIAPKIIYVLAVEKEIGEEIVYIYNKKNEIVYQTNSKYIVSIESDLDMEARPKIFKIETPKEDLTQFVDKKLKTHHFISFHTQQLSDPFSASVFASYLNLSRNLTLTAHATALEYQFFLPWNFPVDFGLIGNYISGSWKKEALGMHWNSTNLGPIIQKQFEIPKVSKHFQMRTTLGVMKSLSFDLKSDEVVSDIKYSSLSTRFSFEALYKTGYGTLGLGPNYSLSKYSLLSADRNIRLNSKKETVKTLGLSFLYFFEVDL